MAQAPIPCPRHFPSFVARPHLVKLAWRRTSDRILRKYPKTRNINELCQINALNVRYNRVSCELVSKNAKYYEICQPATANGILPVQFPALEDWVIWGEGSTILSNMKKWWVFPSLPPLSFFGFSFLFLFIFYFYPTDISIEPITFKFHLLKVYTVIQKATLNLSRVMDESQWHCTFSKGVISVKTSLSSHGTLINWHQASGKKNLKYNWSTDGPLDIRQRQKKNCQVRYMVKQQPHELQSSEK